MVDAADPVDCPAAWPAPVVVLGVVCKLKPGAPVLEAPAPELPATEERVV